MVSFKKICLVCAQYTKMVPFKKILSQIMNGLHTNHFCSMGTIVKFVINMEDLDAELERIEQISLFPLDGGFKSTWRRRRRRRLRRTTKTTRRRGIAGVFFLGGGVVKL